MQHLVFMQKPCLKNVLTLVWQQWKMETYVRFLLWWIQPNFIFCLMQLLKIQPKHNTLNIHVQYFTNKYCVFVVKKHFNNELVIYKLKCKNVYSIMSNKCQVVRQSPWFVMRPMIPQCYNKCVQWQKIDLALTHSRR